MLRHHQRLRLCLDQCSQLRGYISTNWVMPVPGSRPLPGSHDTGVSDIHRSYLPPTSGSDSRVCCTGDWCLVHRRREASSDDNKIN